MNVRYYLVECLVSLEDVDGRVEPAVVNEELNGASVVTQRFVQLHRVRHAPCPVVRRRCTLVLKTKFQT